MTGQVTDTTGALLQGTSVTLVNKSTGVKYTQTTNSRGTYVFANIPPGSGYSLTFSHDGFSSVQVNDISLVVGVPRTQDATLKVGSEQQIEVSAGGQEVTLNTTDASIGGTIDISTLDKLPIQQRGSPAVLFTLVPGFANGSITGARTDQSSTTVDAIDVNDIAAGGDLGTIIGDAPVDSVEQFTTSVAGIVPDQGTGSGGQTQLITKSGTNRFHGNINEYHRDTATEANTWFNNNVGLPRTPIIQNQFGGNIGGPIKRDKLFFFFNFYDSRIIQSKQIIQTVPLDSYRNGTLGYINSNTDATGTPCSASSRSNTDPTCITYLSSAQVANLDPQGIGFNPSLLSFINSRYPHANDLTLGDGVNTGGFRFNSPNSQFDINYVTRIDYNLTSKQKIFGRFTINRANALNQPEFPVDPITNYDVDRSYGYVVGHTWQIGSNKINQFYYGDNISKLSFPAQFVTTNTTTYGLGPFAGPYGSYGSQKRRVPIPEIRDDFNWQKGNHSITFGGQFKFIKTNSQLVGNYNNISVGTGGLLSSLSANLRPMNINGDSSAQSSFDSAFTTALGRIASTGATYDYNPGGSLIPQGAGTSRHYRFFQTELYVGDNWKVTPKLTLDYGLRYMLYSVPYETTGAESVQNFTFDQYISDRVAQSAAGISGDTALPFQVYNLGGKANHGPDLYKPSYKDFAPRFGFSYAPRRSTVIRGSAGLIFDRTVINAVNFIQDQSSQLFQVVGLTNQFGAGGPTNALLNDPRIGAGLTTTAPFPQAPPIQTPFTPQVSGGTPVGLADNVFNFVVDPKLKDPYSIAFTAGVEQELPWHMVMKLNYAGRLGRRLLAQADASQLIDFPDSKSGQTLSAAISNLEQQARAGADYTNVTPIPWFENVLYPGSGAAYGLSNTALVLGFNQPLVLRGDFADTVQWIAANGYMPSNIGLASQFAGNTFLTNKGNSNYNGLLFTLSKNLSNGLQFNFYYTWSHSIDNVSAPANNIASNNGYGYICDALRPRECRGNSDFDVNQRITGEFVYDLPFGRHRTFLANDHLWLDEIVGGWNISGIPTFNTGYTLTTFTDAYIAGYANNAPAIFNGHRHDVAAHVHTDPATGDVQLFADPAKAQADFAPPTGFNIGQRNILRSPSQVGLDMGLEKDFTIIPNSVNLQFRADAFNVLNHPTFVLTNNTTSSTTGTTNLNIDSPSNFGQITQTNSSPRVAQFSLRLEF